MLPLDYQKRGVGTAFAHRRQMALGLLLISILPIMLFILVVRAATIEWANVANSWPTGGDWVGGSAPADSTITDIASFGSTGSSAVNPNLSVGRSINGVSFLASGFGYVIGGSSTLTIGSNGINDSATNAEAFSCQIRTSTSQTWTSNSGSLLTLSGIVDLNSNAATTRTLTLSGAGDFVFTNKIQNSMIGSTGNVTKTGSGNLTLSGANQYSGNTTITGGNLVCGAANVLPSAGPIILSGGTLKTGTTNGFSQTTGTLNLVDASIIVLGSGSHSISFAASSAIPWTASKTLTISGWQGSFDGSPGIAGKIFVGSNSSGLTAAQLAQIVFYDGGSHIFPATILSTGEVVPLSGPTAVKLVSFTAVRSRANVVLRWETGFEAHNLGYYLYREHDGKRERITPSLVAGSALMFGQRTFLNSGHSYVWDDRLAVESTESPRYWLEDVDLNGTHTLHGPIAPEHANQEVRTDPSDRSLLLDELSPRGESGGIILRSGPAPIGSGVMARDSSLATRSDKLKVEAGIASQPGVKIKIRQSGWYRVTQSELVAAGLDPLVNTSHLQLFTNGQEIPIRVSGNGAQLTSSDYLEFYGEELSSSTDASRTYYLVPGNTPGRRILYDDNRPTGAVNSSGSFGFTVERRDRTIYYAALLNGDAENIFGPVISATPTAFNLSIAHPQISGGGEVELNVSLVGVSLEAHHVEVQLNGRTVGTIDFAMSQQPSQSFTIPASSVREGDNTVELKALGSDTDVCLIDTISLTYPHRYLADNDSLSLSVTSDAAIRVDRFTRADVKVVDVTDPLNVVELTPTVDAQADGSFSVEVQVAAASWSQPHILLMFTDNWTQHPASIKQQKPSSWGEPKAGADYLIITTKVLLEQARRLARYRESQGLIVQIVDVEDLYDEYAFGEHTPQAIREFLHKATQAWTLKPRYVLMLGDASFDPRNLLGQGMTDLVPTKLIDTALMETASDDWLADFNEDGVADLAIGRLPARDPVDADRMIGKVIGFETDQTRHDPSALLVADRDFEAASRSVQGVLPTSVTVQSINRKDGADATIHQLILESLNQGPRFVNYLGHGSNGVWTGARLLSNTDAPTLTNTNSLSFFVMMTCLNGYFQDAYGDSLAEALLRSNGGAVAVWASSGMTEPADQRSVNQELYRQVFSQPGAALGDLVRRAKLATADADIRRTWNLFGDPAMTINSASIAKTIYGTIPDAEGRPLPGATVELLGKQRHLAITDARGKYSFDEVESDSYSLMPALVNYTFTPASRTITFTGKRAEAVFVGVFNGGTSNPLDSNGFFIRQQYLDFLNREPDANGFEYWNHELDSCRSDAQCLELKRINVSAAFFLSIEFQDSGFYVERTYKTGLGDIAPPTIPVPVRFIDFLKDTQAVGQGLVVGQDDWQAQLAANKQALALAFVQRADFVTRYPAGTSATAFVRALNANAGNVLTPAEQAVLISMLTPNPSDATLRSQVLFQVAENQTLKQQESNRAFVLMQYFGYLRRNPDAAPDANFAGFNFWLNKLDQANGNYIDAEMVKAFLASDEYRSRFGAD